MAAHDFLGRDAQQLRHVGQVLAVVVHGDFDQHIAALGALAQVTRGDAVHQLGHAHLGGGELHKHGARGRHQLLHAGDGLALQRAQQGQGFIQVDQLHQQGLAVDR